MSVRSLNGLAGNSTNNITNNVYVNTLNNFTGVLPLEVSQGSTTDPVNILSLIHISEPTRPY